MSDMYNRSWIIENALEELKNYRKGVLNIRGLHYRLVSRGMTNTTNHYKRVCSAMTFARWNGLVSFNQFSDFDRDVLGSTDNVLTTVDGEMESSKSTILHWLETYNKNKWENQPIQPEVWIEKKALQGVFNPVCLREGVALAPCKGYPSLTFLNEAAIRFKAIQETGKKNVILYFGDYDPSGEDIPRSIQDNLDRLGAKVEVRRIMLITRQVIELRLPPAPTKPGDTRSKNWDGLGQVELDAVEPGLLQERCLHSIKQVFSQELYEDLLQQEADEREAYQAGLKQWLKTIE